ncbi:3763_t:CDS:2 [Diversispora eburnea]|uniref:3763_t:CDS:1 n=1 Tax=Diversispora eburnea TaxID=1213867 RepID=A0A9N9BCS7_9GLOM|nr:3763_t:CDS:2 [Diversispora eburnea]
MFANDDSELRQLPFVTQTEVDFGKPGIKILYETTELIPVPSGNCSSYFIEEHDAPESYGHDLAFLPMGQVKMNTSESEDIFFTIHINDDTYNHLNQSSPMRIHAFDSDYPYPNKTPPKFIESIETENKYYLAQSNGTKVFYLNFYRLRREELDSSFPTLLGFDPKYDIYNYIASDIEPIEYPVSSNIYAKVIITLKTSVIEIEKEQRHRTILEVLANIAALYGITFSTYVLLFGIRTSEPLLGKFMSAKNLSKDLKD